MMTARVATTSLLQRAAALASDWMNNRIDAFKTDMAIRAAYRQTFDELSALSARELNDLGIARSDISRISREAASELHRA